VQELQDPCCDLAAGSRVLHEKRARESPALRNFCGRYRPANVSLRKISISAGSKANPELVDDFRMCLEDGDDIRRNFTARESQQFVRNLVVVGRSLEHGWRGGLLAPLNPGEVGRTDV
jgi:hypothetical protein